MTDFGADVRTGYQRLRGDPCSAHNRSYAH